MVEGEGSRAPLWLLPGKTLPLPTMHRARFGLGVLVGIAALAAAVPAYVYLAPASVWEPESLLIVLLILSFVSYSAAAPVRGAVTLDASFVAALVAVVFMGPLPAAAVFAAPEISAWIERRRRLVALLGNTAAALWGALAAAWTLEATTGGMPLHPGLQDLPAVALAGAVLLVAGYLVTTLVVSVAWERLEPQAHARAGTGGDGSRLDDAARGRHGHGRCCTSSSGSPGFLRSRSWCCCRARSSRGSRRRTTRPSWTARPRSHCSRARSPRASGSTPPRSGSCPTPPRTSATRSG